MPEYTLTNDMLCCFDNAKVLQKMLEKCTCEGALQTFWKYLR